jgi:hypothetical protein
MREELDLEGFQWDADVPAVRRPMHLEDPSTLSLYPPTFPVELALQTAPVETILETYGFSESDWGVLQRHPVFVRDLAAARDAVKKHGASFKLKAGLQAEAMLERIWEMTHAAYDDVPPAVQAQLIQFTVKAAGLDASKEQGAANQATPLQIQINLR